MDGDFILFLVTMGVLFTIFGIVFYIGKDFKKKRGSQTSK